MQRISIRTEDDINLKGFLFESSEKCKKCVLFVPGLEGNYIECDFIDNLAYTFNKCNYDFLCSHLRSSMQIFNSQPKLGGKFSALTGSAFEKFSDCIYDLNCWLDKIISLGYEEVYIVSHSYGSNKVIYYLNEVQKYNKFLKKIILISPIDCIGRHKKRHNYLEIYNKAKDNVDNGNGDLLLYCGFFYQTSANFIDFMTDPKIDNFPVFSLGEKDFNYYNNINIPKVLVYGEQEHKYVNIINDLIDSKKLKTNFHVIKGANHNYIGSEKQLADDILKLVDGEYND